MYVDDMDFFVLYQRMVDTCRYNLVYHVYANKMHDLIRNSRSRIFHSVS